MPRKDPFADMEALRLRNKALLDPDSNVVELKEPTGPLRKPGSVWGAVYLDEVGLTRPALRLLVVLRYRSFRGRKDLALSAELAREAGIQPRERSRYARMLEKAGKLRVRSDGQHSLIIHVLPRR